MAVLVKSKSDTWGSLRLAQSVLISPARNGHLSSPVLAGNAIFIDEWYQTAEVVKLDRRTLQIIWRVKTREGSGPGGGLSPSRAWSDELILAGGQSRIGMMEAESGRLRWTVTPASASRIWSGRVVAKGSSGILLIDALTGGTTNQIDVPWPMDNGLLLSEGRVITLPLSGGSVGCIDLSSRQVAWQRELLKEMGEVARLDFRTNAIGLAPGSLPGGFVATRGPVIFGVSLEDGSIRWGAPVAVTYYDPNVHEGRIYVLLADHFVCLDESTGAIVYDVQHPQLAEALLPKTGTIYGGKIAFAMESGHLAVFDLADGRLVWMYKHKKRLWSTVEGDGRLFATTDDGLLLVFDEARR